MSGFLKSGAKVRREVAFSTRAVIKIDGQRIVQIGNYWLRIRHSPLATRHY